MNQSTKGLQRDWEDLGQLDPLWAVLSTPAKRHGKWQEPEFYETGREFISGVIAKARSLGAPKQNMRALDFGCGVGRLTLALTDFFEQTVGVDISRPMIERAEKQASASGLSASRIQFVQNSQPDLKLFPNDHFDFVGTYIVLQHIPDKKIIESYIREFTRVLKPGGILYFQVPTHVAWLRRLQPRRRVYAALRAIGFSNSFLYEKLKLHPVFYNFVPLKRVTELLDDCEILDVVSVAAANGAVTSSTFFVTKAHYKN